MKWNNDATRFSSSSSYSILILLLSRGRRAKEQEKKREWFLSLFFFSPMLFCALRKDVRYKSRGNRSPSSLFFCFLSSSDYTSNDFSLFGERIFFLFAIMCRWFDCLSIFVMLLDVNCLIPRSFDWILFLYYIREFWFWFLRLFYWVLLNQEQSYGLA